MYKNCCGTTLIMNGGNFSYRTNSCCCCNDANNQLIVDENDSTSWTKTSYCTLIRSVGFIPVVFVMALLTLTYYPIMILTLMPLFHEHSAGIVVMILYHVLLVLSISSYITTIFTHPGQPPVSFSKRPDAADFATCKHCRSPKPPRAHHCKLCGVCILKMDHHCPWVNTCVGFFNYKFFFLFLLYTTLLCVFTAITLLVRLPFEDLSKLGNPAAPAGSMICAILQLVTVVLSVAFGLSVGLLLGLHCYLLLKNTSTIEDSYSTDKHIYNIGRRENLREVFGDNWQLWLLPIYSSVGDGINYPRLGFDGKVLKV